MIPNRDSATRKILCRDFVPDEDPHPLLDNVAAVQVKRRQVRAPATLIGFGWLLKNPRRGRETRKPERCAIVRIEKGSGAELVFLLSREWDPRIKSLADLWSCASVKKARLIWESFVHPEKNDP